MPKTMANSAFCVSGPKHLLRKEASPLLKEKEALKSEFIKLKMTQNKVDKDLCLWPWKSTVDNLDKYNHF